MSLLFSHPTGNANVRAALQGLNQANSLAEFYTAIAVFDNTFLNSLSNINVFKELKRRRFDRNLNILTTTYPYYELMRIILGKLNLKSLTKHEKGIFSIDNVYRTLDDFVAKKISKNTIDGVYAYEDGALTTFQRAKEVGIKCYYDLPIGYWKSAREFMEVEIERYPEWASTITGMKDSKAKLDRKDEELALADTIFVASQFTANTLSKYKGELAPVKIIPYGFPTVKNSKEYQSFHSDRVLKALFVGGLSQRKGIADLFNVVKKIGSRIELTVVGKKSVDNCKILNETLNEYNWIPSLPHHLILEEMEKHDILIFPSLFEGFGLVITEAMSRGTPVLTTNRTAGLDFIKHGENGWLINAGSTEELEECIVSILNNPKKIIEIGKAAQETARKRTWAVYGLELANEIISGVKK